MDIDMHRVVPDPRLSLDKGAIHPWHGPKRAAERRALREACASAGIPLDVPFGELSEAARAFVLEGAGEGGRRGWQGVRGWFRWLERKSYRMHVRIFLARFRAYLP